MSAGDAATCQPFRGCGDVPAVSQVIQDESVAKWLQIGWHLGGSLIFGSGSLGALGFSPVFHNDIETFQLMDTCVGEVIFADGFEMGSTIAWSVVVP